ASTPPPRPAPDTPSPYPATRAAPYTPPVHPPTQTARPRPAQPPLPSAPGGGYAYPPAAGSRPNPAFPGAAGGHRTGQWQPQQPRGRNRSVLVAAAVAAAVLIGGGAYLLGQQGADKGSNDAKDGRTGGAAQPGGATPEATGSGGGGKGEAPAPPKGTPYKNLSIPVGYAVMFADQPPRPEDLDVNYEGDFGYSGDMINGDRLATNQSENTMALLAPSEPGSLDGCLANTRYTTSIDVDKVGKGSRICVKTGSGHYGLVTVHGFASKDSPSQYVSVDLTVWRNVTD
ncbi:hypothetical protein ABZ371_28425, partial [Streptomyces sp. NPDC005899]